MFRNRPTPSQLEADRVAETLVRMLEGQGSPAQVECILPPAPVVQRLCAQCEMKSDEDPEEEDKEKPVPQTKLLSSAAGESSVREGFGVLVPPGSGRTLPPSVRAFFESRVGRDFSQVRIYADARTAESARALKALAFTTGKDVVFGASHR